MSQKERFKKRNQAVRNEFNKLVREQPKWRIDAIIDDVADKFFIASRTAEAIIKSEGIYKDA